ncbi:nucleoside-diphosphate-sugar epimerase [Desulfobotulus alkaliphilus]|uniref:Nucleoside-diphosphate-sugar epimerase n=1 Tax=Desulfobotulus alkaliphilus TaxID=622671 RepID=A0A562S6E9_9BACT|nr:SDR family oxidoreductase [Desulfobotulus alkaliphilus]TWI76902.1 nucleoside-diphosphate-sugar epimerase [Desulfobotulus alkaliphilus]
MIITVTGANGFIGSHLLGVLSASGHRLTAVMRSTGMESCPGDCIRKIIDGLDTHQNWREILKGQDIVIHCAARVHMMQDNAEDPLKAFRQVNVEGTLNLARQAAEAGVRRFVFLSSIKVNGEKTTRFAPFKPDDIPFPQDPYGISKMEAEKGLWEIASATGMELVIIRPVLVYGSGVKGNFRKMALWLEKGLPLPLGSIKNLRSMISLENLTDFISLCAEHPAAANEVFLVSDGEDLSTTDLLRSTGKAMGKTARLIPVPESWLYFCAVLTGKKKMAHRLLGSLRVDIGKNKELLGWTPPLSVEEGLRRCFR